MSIIVSSPQRAVSTERALDQNSTHLSLGYAARRFEVLFTLMGHDVRSASRPDVLRSKEALHCLPAVALSDKIGFSLNGKRETFAQDKLPLHLNVAHWRQMRLALAASWNVCHLSWEQEILPRSPWANRFGADMLSTLRAFDEVWTCANFVERTLRASGIRQTKTIPTPIISPVVRPRSHAYSLLEAALIRFQDAIFCPRFVDKPDASVRASVDSQDIVRALNALRARHGNENRPIFVTQGNPGDVRKNLLSCIIAFSLFVNNGNPDAVLFVKTPPRSRRGFYEEISSSTELLLRWGWLASENIFIIPANMTDQELLALYCAADFYICAPIAEGQNVPLQEAIQCGAYPITPIHTAMSEYLSQELVTEIPSTRVVLDPETYCGECMDYYHGYLTDVGEIASAIQTAMNVPLPLRAERVRELQEIYLAKYTLEGVATRIFMK